MKRVLLVALVVLALGVPEVRAELLPDPLPSPDRAARCGKATASESVNYVWYTMRDRVGARFEVTPHFHFTTGPFLAMWVKPSFEGGFPEVTVARWSRLALTGIYGCAMKREAEASLVHEFAHVYQQPWVREGRTSNEETDEAIPEGLAEAFSENVMRQVFGFRREDYDRDWDVYDAYAREIRRRYPPAFINRGQFGSNWGADPTLISF